MVKSVIRLSDNALNLVAPIITMVHCGHTFGIVSSLLIFPLIANEEESLPSFVQHLHSYN